MARTRSYTYWHAPCRASMKLDEGAWTDDDTKKLGGGFAAEMNKDCFVKLSGDWTVTKSTTASIGMLMTDPIGGTHETNGRYGTVLLFGDYILECEIQTQSDTIAIGESITAAAGTGTLNNGMWTRDGSANGTYALAAYTTGSTAGSTIPVLFGYIPF